MRVRYQTYCEELDDDLISDEEFNTISDIECYLVDELNEDDFAD
jgi:hypothetical protein